MVFELTGSFEAFLSLSIVSICSYLVANVTRVEPFYERLLASLVAKSSDDETKAQVDDPRQLGILANMLREYGVSYKLPS